MKLSLSERRTISDETKRKISETKRRNGPSKRWLEVMKKPRVSDAALTYAAAHKRVQKVRGKAERCTNSECPGASKTYEWASLNKRYWDVNDYVALCKSCHERMDKSGKRHKNARLSADTVRAIRSLAGHVRNCQIAKRLNVSQITVHRVINRICYDYDE